MPRACVRRAQSPSRDVSPVPSYYSEPISLPRHKDVLRGLSDVGEGDREDAEEVLSLRSLPCARNTSNKDLHRVKRSRGLPPRQLVTDVSDVRLPAINHQQQESRSTLIVRGFHCGRKLNKCPPILSSRWDQGYNNESSLPERPPGRAGRRPDRQAVSCSSFELNPAHHHSVPKKVDHALKLANEMGPELSSKHSSHNPLGPSISPHRHHPIAANHASHGVTHTAVLPRPGWRRGGAFQRGALECVWEEGCGQPPPPYRRHHLEPLSGFREQLRRQLLHSPLPYRDEAAPGPRGTEAPPSARLQPSGAAPAAPAAPQRTVTVLLQEAPGRASWRGRTLPKITMTRPTPSPKHAPPSRESRQSA